MALGRDALPWILIAVAATLLCHLPSFRGQLLNWDDYTYILADRWIQTFSWHAVVAIFTKLEFLGNYHPLTRLSYLGESRLFHDHPLGYHAVSVALHLVNTALVFWFLHALSGNRRIAFLAALLFGIHPLHVESVSWISERKDLLYTMFFLGSLIAYIGHLRRGGYGRFYALSIVLFLLAALSKGMAVSLVAVLLLVDFVSGRRFGRATVLEKLPYLAIAVAFGVVALFAQKAGSALHGFREYSFAERVILAAHSLLAYLAQLVAPFRMSAFYPYPRRVDGALPLLFRIDPLLVVILAAVVLYSLRRTRTLFFGAAFFLATIFLVLQLLPVGGAVRADRYTYIPSIGLFYLAGVGYERLRGRLRGAGRVALHAAIAAYCVFLGVVTWNRVSVWRDTFTLWGDVLRQYPWVSFPYDNRGYAYYRIGRYDEALRDFQRAVELEPNRSGYLHHRGIAEFQHGRYAEAIADMNQAVSLTPDVPPDLYNNRGAAYSKAGNTPAAIADFSKAIELDPEYRDALVNRGTEYASAGMFEAALADFDAALKVDPASADARRKRDLAARSLERRHAGGAGAGGGAAAQGPEFYLRRGLQYGRTGNVRAAIADFTTAIQLQPGSTEARNNRGIAYAMLGAYDSAFADFDQVLRVRPNDVDAYYNRGVARRAHGDTTGACDDFARAASMSDPRAKVAYERFCR